MVAEITGTAVVGVGAVVGVLMVLRVKNGFPPNPGIQFFWYWLIPTKERCTLSVVVVECSKHWLLFLQRA